MKYLLTRFLVALGLVSFFKGTTNHFEAHASEGSSSSSPAACETMGGRTGGCGKCN